LAGRLRKIGFVSKKQQQDIPAAAPLSPKLALFRKTDELQLGPRKPN
jgi:hypothetical protein